MLIIEGIALALLLLALVPPPDPIEPGFLTRYSLGVMKRVTAKRHMEWSGCGVAIDNQKVGSFVLVRGVKTGIERTCQVVDWSMPKDKARHVKVNLLELDSNNQAAVCGAKAAMSGWRSCPVLIRRGVPDPRPPADS